MSKYPAVLFRSRACSPVYLAFSLLSFLLAVVLAISYGTWHLIKEATVYGSLFGIVGLSIVYASYFRLILTEDALLIKNGLRVSTHPLAQVEDVLLIPTPVFPTSIHGSAAVRVTIPRPTGPVDVLSAWDTLWPLPWFSAPQSLLLLNRGSQSNYVLPHQQAEHLVGLIANRVVKQ